MKYSLAVEHTRPHSARRLGCGRRDRRQGRPPNHRARRARRQIAAVQWTEAHRAAAIRTACRLLYTAQARPLRPRNQFRFVAIREEVAGVAILSVDYDFGRHRRPHGRRGRPRLR